MDTTENSRYVQIKQIIPKHAHLWITHQRIFITLNKQELSPLIYTVPPGGVCVVG